MVVRIRAQSQLYRFVRVVDFIANRNDWNFARALGTRDEKFARDPFVIHTVDRGPGNRVSDTQIALALALRFVPIEDLIADWDDWDFAGAVGTRDDQFARNLS